MKCNNCNRNAFTTAPTGLSGVPTESSQPVCHIHYAEWLFNQPDANGIVGVGDGLYYAPVHLMPAVDDGRTFEVAVNIPPASTLGSLLPEDYAKQLEYVESELFDEITGANYNGDAPVGYVVVDADADDEYFQTWGAFAEHSVTGKATPQEA